MNLKIKKRARSVLRMTSITVFVTFGIFLVLGVGSVDAQSTTDPVQSQSVGVSGTISSPPPSQAPTISFPTNGASFSQLPINVTGICTSGLTIKVFKNNVFAGSVTCNNGSYSMQIDLFSGTNELIARGYDAIDQASPDSNLVTVQFNDSAPSFGPRISITTNYAKRGANPGQELIWPVILSGGSPPYALSVDWGDGKPADIISVPFAGAINLKHVYDSPGVYNIVIKATDRDGVAAFIQLVGIANGPLDAAAAGSNGDAPGALPVNSPVRVLWQPIAVTVPMILATFWLGKRYEVKMLKHKIARGERPFA